MKKTLTFVMLTILTIISVGGIQQVAEAKTKTLTLWCAYSQPARVEAMDDAIAEYEALNPGIKVVRELVPWSNTRQKWIAARMAKTLPQMIVDGDGSLITFWDSGDLEPVDDVIEKVGGADAFLPGPLNGLRIDGKQIAMPHYTLSWKMVVRKDWLEELGLDIPKTWDDFAKAAIAMTDPPNRYGFDLPLSKSASKSREWLAYFMRSNGAEFFDKDGKVNFYTPQTIETVTFLVNLFEKTGRQAAINYTENDCIDNFVKGNVGFVFAAGSLLRNLAKNDPSLIDKMEVIDTPYNLKPGIDGAGLVGIAKFKDAKYSEETSDFLAFLLSPEIYRKFLVSMPNMIPITVATSNDEVYWNDPFMKEYKEHLQKWVNGAMTGARVGLDYGASPVYGAGLTGSEIEDMFQSIIVDGISIDTAVKATHDKIAAQLKAAGY